MIKYKLTNKNIDIRRSLYKRIANPFYIIAVTLTAIGTYGYYLANPSPSIDWLSYDEYYTGLLFGQGRFTATFVERILELWNCPVWFEPLLGIVCFIFGSLILLSVFDGFKDENSIVPSIVFSCVYISFPLLPEYFIYNGAILTVGGCTILFSLALYFSIKYEDFLRSFLLPIVFITLVFSWYECMILPYIGAVFAIMILKENKDGKIKSSEIFLKGIYHAIILAVGVIFEFAVTKIIIKIFSIRTNSFAQTQSYWTFSIQTVKNLFRSYLSYWGLKIFCNPAFTILFLSGIVFFILFVINIKRTRSFSSILLYLGSLIPVFAMTLYRGGGAEYRAEQGMPFFVAFTAYLLCINIEFCSKNIKRIFSVLFAFMMIIQIGSSNRCYWINNQRFEEEKNTILTVNNIITNKFDKNKPVIFVGGYEISTSLNNKISVSDSSPAGKIIHRFASEKSYDKANKIYDYIGRSYIEWGIKTAFDPDKPESELYKFCEYIGVSFKHCTKEQYDEAINNYKDMPIYPEKGCISDNGEYIIVRLK